MHREMRTSPCPWLVLTIFIVQAWVTLAAPVKLNQTVTSSASLHSNASPPVVTVVVASASKYRASLLNQTLLPFLHDCETTQVNRTRIMCNAYFDAVETLNHTSSTDFQTAEQVRVFLDKPDADSDTFCARLAAVLPTEAKYKLNLLNFTSYMSHISRCSSNCFKQDDTVDENPPVLPVCRLIEMLYRTSSQNVTAQPNVPATSAVVTAPVDVADKTKKVAELDAKVTNTPIDVNAEKTKQTPAAASEEKPVSHSETKPEVTKVATPEGQSPINSVETPTKEGSSKIAKVPAIEPVIEPTPPSVEVEPTEFRPLDDDWRNSNTNMDDDEDETHPGDGRHEITMKRDPEIDEKDSSFFSMFMILLVLIMAGYVVYHNRRFMFALLLEGRRRGGGGDFGSGRRKHTAAYRKLDSNLEEAIASPNGTTSRSQPIIY